MPAPRHDKYQGLCRYPDGSWGIDCYLGEKRVRRKIGLETEARHELQKLKVAFREGDPVDLPAAANAPCRACMKEVLESYSSHVSGETERVYAARWIATLGNRLPEQVTVPLLRPWIKGRLEKAKPSTVHRAIDVLRAAFNDGKRTGLISASLANPLDDRKALGLPRVDNLRQVDLTGQQEAAFVDALGEWWPYARFALLTGIRFGNLARMRWEDINWERSFVMLEKVKARPKLPLPLSPEALALLRLQEQTGYRQEGGRSEWCWPSREGRQLHKDNFRNRVWKPAMEKAGIPLGTRWHDLRHTMASRLVEATGGDLYVVRDALGQASYRTTERYAHISAGRVRSAVNLLSREKEKAPPETGDAFWLLFWSLQTGYRRGPVCRWTIEHRKPLL